MANPQTNLRLEPGIAQQLRVRAAQEGVDAARLVEDALEQTYAFSRDASSPIPGQGELLSPAATPTPETSTHAEGSASPPKDSAAASDPAESTGGCLSCGGDWITIDGRTVCEDCHRAKTP